MKIGYIPGVFDLFHIGHLNILRRAKSECDYLIVGLTTDELCLSVKRKLPVIPYNERSEIVKSIIYVDEVIPQISMNKLEAWEKLKFNVIFVGDDWKGSERWIQHEKEFKKLGVEIIYLPYTNSTSSTLLRRILENEVKK